MAIHEKILSVMKRVEHIQKDDKVSYKTTNYKALSEEKVTTIMRKAMIENGLVVYPIAQEWSRSGQITHVDVVYKIVDVETGEAIEVVSCGDGADTQDKGAGKAMTYAFKYMWLRTFAIPTGEDPDKIASAELDDLQETKRKTTEPATYKKKEEPEQEEPSEPIAYDRKNVEEINDIQVNAIKKLMTDAPPERAGAFNIALDYYHVENIKELNKDEAAQLIRRLSEYK